jgi:prepilin-type N-terminal cleavage/methylation domain-containing protein
MRRPQVTSRDGLSLLEVMVALTILGTALIGLAEYGRRFARTNGNAMTQNSAMDIAVSRLERVKSMRSYTAIDTMAGTISVLHNGLSYTQTTAIAQTLTSQLAYKTITVTVNRPGMLAPVKKTSAIARF